MPNTWRNSPSKLPVPKPSRCCRRKLKKPKPKICCRRKPKWQRSCNASCKPGSGASQMQRREFPDRVRMAAWDRCGGTCENCGFLLKAGGFVYNHRIADYLGGQPTLENCEVLCRACDLARTFGNNGDIAKISKTRRIRKRQAGIRKPRTITAWRLFDGSIRRMPKERE